MEKNLIDEVKAKANIWLNGDYDAQTKQKVQEMLSASDTTELVESFYKDLEFGTGGLRGIMGVGTNRMNIYTVGAATQGLANYLHKNFGKNADIKVVVGHDCRNNSRLFAETTANIFSANGIKVFLFENLRPTPEISFAIRHLGCQSGVVVTASHNPKEYNGYKAYWEDGAQVIPPHDTGIIAEVNKIKSIKEIKFQGNPALIQTIGEDVDSVFLEKIKKLSLSPDIVAKQKDLKIVYTPIHGTGITLIPRALKMFGFENIISVDAQNVISGDFPTVLSPNPEEPAAMKLAVEKAKEVDADIVMASDPDADRMGIAVKNDKGEWILVNGNQTAQMFVYYLIRRNKELKRLKGNEYIVKTIVTTEQIAAIAKKFNVPYFDVYTGFKWIAAVMREQEGKKTYIGGGEESYGFLVEDFVRDKDAVSACVMIAEITAWAKQNGMTIYELLQDIYLEFGFSKEKGISVVKKGKDGAEAIKKMMSDFRSTPPVKIAGSRVVTIKDYASLRCMDIVSGSTSQMEMPETANVLQYFTEDGTKISVRPSGTEPKIKFYIEVRLPLKNRNEFDAVNAAAEEKINAVKASLGL
ncbi:MAG: phospho-sugar mutase [Paludibacteraceae bacterium]|nr:phospho-sugar mutase [Paludibacteraceae bacterium]